MKDNTLFFSEQITFTDHTTQLYCTYFFHNNIVFIYPKLFDDWTGSYNTDTGELDDLNFICTALPVTSVAKYEDCSIIPRHISDAFFEAMETGCPEMIKRFANLFREWELNYF